MTETNQKQLGNTLWKIVDNLRAAVSGKPTITCHALVVCCSGKI
jgi:hypothetical protein